MFHLLFDADDLSDDHIRLIEDTLATADGAASKFQWVCSEKSVNVVITGEGYIQELNATYREKNSVTDVLSFPLSQPGDDEQLLGEIYICWARVEEQSQVYGHSLEREFAWLLCHGLLHLLGYEHGEEPDPEMRRLEEEFLNYMNIGGLL